mgnify:CR=1 FL=1
MATTRIFIAHRHPAIGDDDIGAFYRFARIAGDVESDIVGAGPVDERRIGRQRRRLEDAWDERAGEPDQLIGALVREGADILQTQFDAVAQGMFKAWFETEYPDYPSFEVKVTEKDLWHGKVAVEEVPIARRQIQLGARLGKLE